MGQKELHVVTGAFGYSGKYIARRLLDAGHRVRTITSALGNPDPFGGEIERAPLNFQDAAGLEESLRGAKVLYNTYWVRFNHGAFSHSQAVANTLALFAAARRAGVERIVHVSITNPRENSTLEYFSGKALLERSLRESGTSHTIIRPTVLFGKEDILINNIAWILRRLPVVGVFGDGSYKIQPVYVDDLARLAVQCGGENENITVDAVGPETFTYRELLQAIGEIIGKRRLIVPVSPWLGYMVGAVIGKLVGDVFITREEIEGLMQGLLAVETPPTGSTRLTEWARDNAETLGMSYASELSRRRG